MLTYSSQIGVTVVPDAVRVELAPGGCTCFTCTCTTTCGW